MIMLVSTSSYAQDQRVIDSVKIVIQNAKHDTLVCNAYMAWGEQVYLNNPDTALILWLKAEDIALRNVDNNETESLKIKYLLLVADAQNNVACIHYAHGKIEKGLEYFFKSLKQRGEISNSTDPQIAKEARKGVATSLNNIGAIYNQQGNIPNALEYFHRSLKIEEEIGDKEDIATSFNNLGFIYEDQGEIATALDYYFKSLKLYEEAGSKAGMAGTLNNIGVNYKVQGNIHKALEYYHESLIMYEETGNKANIATALINVGFVYEMLNDTIKAVDYFQKSLDIYEEIGHKAGIANALNHLGHIQINLGELRIARINGNRGLLVARELGAPALISSNADLLYKVAKLQGDYDDALKMYELHIQMRDSINNEKTQKATIRQQTKYEFEKAQLVKEQKEREFERIESEKTSRRDNLQYSVIVMVIVIVFGLILTLTRVNVSVRLLEGLIFFSFLIFFEFLLVLADPYIENWSGGAPGFKLLFNAGIAALIFPLHSLFETKLKGRLVKR